MLKQSNLITVACCLLPVASFHQPIFNLVQDLSFSHFCRAQVQGNCIKWAQKRKHFR
ncbi:MAG: hypothetical protein F6K31_04965 [Symploca sp. SIO2G7]|nr:hypothetical protein [Symploca sp. SIO2G7]